MSAGLIAAWALMLRDLRRFVRQPSRIVAAIATPALIWVFLASGLARAIESDSDAGYGLYLLPGMATLTVMFSSIFVAISLIEDRHEGFLQGVLTSPTPRWAIVVAKTVAGGIVATAQGAVLVASAPLLGSDAGPLGYTEAIAALGAIAIAIGSIGIAAAWWVDSTQGFHGIMNTVLMPMWLLSGALFPLESSAGWLRWAMLANPLTWATSALRSALHSDSLPPAGPEWLVWGITLATATIGLALAWSAIGAKSTS
jgi:ABC-2 type transport system permease protein